MKKNVLATAALSVGFLGTAAVSAAPFFVIDGDGNAAGTYTVSDANLITGQTVGGLGAAIFDSMATRNAAALITASAPRPLLADNHYLSAEVYVDVTDVGETSQGENRIKIYFRNPDGGAQLNVWAGTTGGAGGAGLQWFPDAGTWTTFSYDLAQESWWVNDYSTWEVFRVELFENDDPLGTDPENHDNTFAIRNLQFTNVPEPGSIGLMAIGGAMVLGRHRRAAALS